MSGTEDEKLLLLKSAHGDRAAFSVLYNLHLRSLYRYTYLFLKSKEASEEIVQDVFVKIWEKKEQLEHVISFKSYLYRINKNLIIDQVRRAKTELKVFDTLLLSAMISEEVNEETIDYKQYMKVAKVAIELLPEKRKAIFLMRTQEEMSLDEIATSLSISKSVVKKQLYAAITFVRDYLHKHGELSICIFLFLLF